MIRCTHCGAEVTIPPSRGALMMRADSAGAEVVSAQERLDRTPTDEKHKAVRLNAQAALVLAKSCKEAADAALEEAGGRYGTTPKEGVTL